MEEEMVAETGLGSTTPLLVAMLVTTGAIGFKVFKKQEA